MQLDPDFREFVESFNAHEVRYLVVGGYALAAHGLPRATPWERHAVEVAESGADARRRRDVGGHEILPIGGHETARWWPTVLPTGGQWFCPR